MVEPGIEEGAPRPRLHRGQRPGVRPLPAAPRLSPRDLYQLRRVHLKAAEAALLAQQARGRLEAIILELEQRYGLLGHHATVDIRTGQVTLEPQAPAGAHGDGEERPAAGALQEDKP